MDPASPTAQRAIGRHGVMAEAFEELASGLGPFIDQRMARHFSDAESWSEVAANRLGRPAEHGATDPLFQLLVLRRFWGPVFAEAFGADLRGLIGELIETRNRWAHFSLPDDADQLQRSVLAIERLVAPIRPESAASLRRLRTLIDDPAGHGAGDDQPASPVDVSALEAQLSETEAVFVELQDRYGQLERELSTSRRVAATRQLRLSALERRLGEIEARTRSAEELLADERTTRYRVEWLFIGLVATLLLFMILAGVV
jgi:hypothetical protein